MDPRASRRLEISAKSHFISGVEAGRTAAIGWPFDEALWRSRYSSFHSATPGGHEAIAPTQHFTPSVASSRSASP